MYERYKAIVDPPEIHHAYVSNTGKVKYLNQRGVWRTTLGSKQNGGYHQVKLGRKKYCVHLLVAKQFIPKLCKTFTVVHHADAVRSNNSVSNLSWTTQMLNCSQRTNSNMCYEKAGLFYCKFIFDGKCIRSVDGYETIEEARLHALTLRKQLYDSTYNSLIENEIANQSLSSSTAGESDSGICDKS